MLTLHKTSAELQLINEDGTAGNFPRVLQSKSVPRPGRAHDRVCPERSVSHHMPYISPLLREQRNRTAPKTKHWCLLSTYSRLKAKLQNSDAETRSQTLRATVRPWLPQRHLARTSSVMVFPVRVFTKICIVAAAPPAFEKRRIRPDDTGESDAYGH